MNRTKSAIGNSVEVNIETLFPYPNSNQISAAKLSLISLKE
jgi:hypothetical protein